MLSKLVPLRASPMNDVLIGWPNTGNSATMLAQATPKSAATQLGMEDHNASGGSGTIGCCIKMPYEDLSLTPAAQFAQGKVALDTA